MPISFTIDVTGTTPVYVYLCDNPITNCIYIDSVNTFPYTFTVPPPFDDQTSYNIKVVNDDGCEKIELVNL